MSVTIAKSEESTDSVTATERASTPLTFVLIGDVGVGKSALVGQCIDPSSTFTPGNYVPTTWEEYNVAQRVKDGFRGHHDVDLSLIDIGGQPELDRFRPLCFTTADVFILCFSVVVPSSFQALTSKYVPEIRRHCHSKQANILLVGTQADLRSNTSALLKLSAQGETPVAESRAIRLSQKIGAKNYIECSALSRRNTKQVFDYGILIGLQKLAKIPTALALLENNLDQMIFPENRKNSKTCGKENNIFLKHQRRVTKRLRKGNKLKRILLSCLFH